MHKEKLFFHVLIDYNPINLSDYTEICCEMSISFICGYMKLYQNGESIVDDSMVRLWTIDWGHSEHEWLLPI